MPVPLIDYASSSPEVRAQLESALAELTTLERVLNWGRRLVPPVAVDEILTQDEYTHDVLMALSGGRYLNFDTT